MRLSEKILIAQTVLLVVFTSWAFGGRVSWAPPWIMGLAALGVAPLALAIAERRKRLQAEGKGPGSTGEEGDGEGANAQRSTFNAQRATTKEGEGAGTGKDRAAERRQVRPPTTGDRQQTAKPLRSQGKQKPPTPRILLLPWVLFVALIAVSFFNPSYEPAGPEAGGGLVPREHVEWLPSTVSPARTAQVGGLLAAVIFQTVVVFRVLRTRRATQMLLALVCLNALALAITGTVFRLLGTEEILGLHPSQNDSFFATFVYKNHWAAFALLSLCTAIGLLFQYLKSRRGELKQTRGTPLPFFIAALLLLGLTIPLPGSRSGMALLVIVAVVLFARISGQLLHRSRLRAGQRAGAFALLLLVTAAFVGYGYYLAAPAIERSARTTEEQLDQFWQTGRLEDRWYNAQNTWRMAQAQPAWGWGLGTFPLVSPAFHGDFYRNANTGEIGAYLIDAHSDWLQFLAELGWTGFALLLATPLAAFLVYLARGRGNPLSRWALFGCGLILLYAIAEFPFQNPAVFILFGITFSSAIKYGLLKQKP